MKSKIDGQFVPTLTQMPLVLRLAGINTRRLIDFLMQEEMNHGGQENGKLKAPNKQLYEWGIGRRHVAGAIREAEALGFVAVHRGGMRVATTYALTWRPTHDGKPPSHRWKNHLPKKEKSE